MTSTYVCQQIMFFEILFLSYFLYIVFTFFFVIASSVILLPLPSFTSIICFSFLPFSFLSFFFFSFFEFVLLFSTFTPCYFLSFYFVSNFLYFVLLYVLFVFLSIFHFRFIYIFLYFSISFCLFFCFYLLFFMAFSRLQTLLFTEHSYLNKENGSPQAFFAFLRYIYIPKVVQFSKGAFDFQPQKDESRLTELY